MTVERPLEVLHLGAGVQSTTLALMAAHGLITPMPDFALFADVGDEPRDVYAHLDWLRSANVLPFPVYIVRRPFSVSDALRASARAQRDGHTLMGQVGTPPMFVAAAHPGDEGGMLSRQCTANWKIKPLNAYTRRIAVERFGKDVVRAATQANPVARIWLGISTDEASRMKPSQEKWKVHRYPLAMEHRMSRGDCLAWMARNDYPRPPRSACVFCPYHSQEEWRHIRDNHPDEWQAAIDLEREVTEGLEGQNTGRRVFFHRQRKPLDQVDLDSAEDLGQRDWLNECEGYCGN